MLVNESSQSPDSSGKTDSPVNYPVSKGEVEVETCGKCGLLMDMTDVKPFTLVTCPQCGESHRAQQHFNHFTLLQLVGEGGLGSVFKAQDDTLDRFVALKILKTMCSADGEEREKLAREARMAAAINHPHVAKVFDFGQAHGRFYMAMEYVEKGSLDDLMAIQKRVAEAQVLKVGVQIAEGLEAANEQGLIHRDIKPGNILFADAHNAKLVDFGLAIVMDEAAQSRGEIWGTPYYIAPEKLDDHPEDFRSDIYSLGGTLFHALAGRPPYDAESASMVALKQLKSQPVSLQAFAPDVSSETAYVINRMMAKNPEDRYASYAELIGHLSYAREKLIERARMPIQQKERALGENAQSRKFFGLLSLGLVVAVFLIGFGLFLMRDKFFPSAGGSVTDMIEAGDAQSKLISGASALASGDYVKGRDIFQKLAADADIPQPQKSWALINAALANLLVGENSAALANLNTLREGGLYSANPDDLNLANFFVEAARVTAGGRATIPASTSSSYNSREEAFALLLFAVWDWEERADFAQAAELFNAFLKADPSEAWINQYRRIAEKYLHEWELLQSIETASAAATSPQAASALLAKVSSALSGARLGSPTAKRLDEVKKRLESIGAKP